MDTVKVNQRVIVPEGRTAIVTEVDEKNRTAQCSVDLEDVGIGGPTKRAWYGFEDLKPA